jgi:enoyl-CoA hydratase
MELALTGEFIDAERAYELGLVNRIVDGDAETAALDAAKELARTINANGPLAVRVSKQIVDESRGWSIEERWQRQAQLLPQVFMSEDAREGAAAFAEKRKPNWKGK